MSDNLLLYGDICCNVSKVRKSNVKNGVEFSVVVFSSSFRYADLSFSYRVSSSDTWKNDAVISVHDGMACSKGKLFGLTTSKNGTEHIFRWEYGLNGMVNGSSFEYMVQVMPSPTKFGYLGSGFTVVESGCGSMSRRIENIVLGKVLGKDREGNFMMFVNSKFNIVDPAGDLLLVSSSTYDNITQAIHSDHETYIFLDSGTNYGLPSLVEMDETGTVLNSSDLSSYATNIGWFDYNPASHAVIFQGTSAIIELSWENGDWGDLLWTSPAMVANTAVYNPSNYDVLWATIGGAINKIDRTNRLSVATSSITVTRYGNTIPMSFGAGTFISPRDGSLVVTRADIPSPFNADPSIHPSLVRDRAANLPDASVVLMDQFRELRNALNSPVLDGMEA